MKNSLLAIVTACLAFAGCFDNRSRPSDVLTVASLHGLAATNKAEIVRLFLRGTPLYENSGTVRKGDDSKKRTMVFKLDGVEPMEARVTASNLSAEEKMVVYFGSNTQPSNCTVAASAANRHTIVTNYTGYAVVDTNDSPFNIGITAGTTNAYLFVETDSPDDVRFSIAIARRKLTSDDLKDLSKTGLQQLDLSECDLTAVPETVWDLKGLTSFWFVRNKLAAIPDEVADLPELTYLNLDGNEITAIPDALARATKLRWLRLNGNQISELPGSLAALKDMRRLYMRQNKLTAVPEVVKEWPELEDLVLDGNDITSVPDWVGKDLKKLKSLSLKGCKKITRLPDDLSGLRTLSVLNVADCSFPSEEVERIRKALGDNVVILF